MANRRYIDFPIASSVGDSDIILIWQSGANKQTTKATFLSGLPENLDELNDVAISGLTNGQILRYDSVTGKWENTDQGNLDLNDLNDVQIVSPSNGQVLVYNSSTSRWENSSGGYVPYTGAVTTVNLGAQTIQAGSFVKAGGTSAQFLKANGSVDSTAYGTGSVTSVALTMPSAFSVANSPVTTAGTLAVTGAGTVGQYIRGDGSLADFPESSGGGSSVSYYLNGSVAQGTIGGVAYKELNKVPILGAGTDFTINANGYIASFITDAGDPNLLEIPAGNWTFETYFSASSGGGSPSFYVELYKVNSGGTATLIASNSTFPELIAFGTNVISYFSTLAVPTTTLALTDRLAIRYYVTHSGRTITLHTEDNHLCQIITTFTTGLTALNGLTAQIQNFAVGTSGTDFAIASATATHTFNLPTASATNRGALSSADWTTFNGKQNALTLTTTGSSGAATLVGATLNIPQYQAALTNPVTGTGSAGQVAYWSSGSEITGESALFWDATNNRLGINNASPEVALDLGNTGGQKFYNYNGGSGNRNGLGVDLGGNTFELSVFFAYGESDNGRITFGSLNGTTYSTKMTIFGNGNVLIVGNNTANSFIKSGGTSSQFLKADGSVDSSIYYLASNPFGFTTNVGTVTSVTATAGTGISISGSPITSSGTLTITNTAPDQVVSLTASTGISISGTYPNFTITNTSPSSGGTVTSVTASSPLFSSGGNTPNITIQQASGSQSGFLSSTDWTTFNNKQNALTNPVTGTGTTNTLPKFTGTSTIANSQVFDNGTSVSIGSTALSQKFIVVGGNGNQMSLDNTGQRFTQLNFNNNGSQKAYLATDNTNNLFEIYGLSGYSLSFGADGGQKMSLTTSGNVLIGTTTDNSNKLRVEGQVFINANTQLDSKTTTGVGSSAVAIASFSGAEGSTYFITAVNGANYYRALVNQVQTSVTIVNSISVGTVGSVSISTSSNILTMAISSGTWTVKCTQIRTV